MIVEERLGRVQDARPGDAACLQAGGQCIEICSGRLVRTDVLGREDGVEPRSEAFGGGGEALPVHIRQHDQFVVPAEPGQRPGAVGEGGPVRDGAAERDHIGLDGRASEVRAHPHERPREHLRIGQAGRLGLLAGLVGGEAFEHGAVFGLDAFPFGPGAPCGENAGFPVDQRAVAVEAERIEVPKPHARTSVVSTRRDQ